MQSIDNPSAGRYEVSLHSVHVPIVDPGSGYTYFLPLGQ